jgi:cytochrome P450/nitrite reductase/ring-hydroxylating ferredoxin subunit
MAATSPRVNESRSGEWKRAARIEDLDGDGPHSISAGGMALVAVRSGGALRVFEGRCPHQGALLGEGELEGNALVCRNHRWKFNRESGQRIGGRQCLIACPTEERAGELFVDVGALVGAAKDQEPPARRQIQDLPGPKGLPLLGSALDLDVTRLHLQLEDWAKRYGPMYTIRLGRRTVIVIAAPELGETILRGRPDTYRRVATVESVFAEMAVSGVFSAEGEAWRPQRRLAVEALAQRHLRSFYPTLELVASRLLGRWESAADAGRVIDLADELKRFTVDVTTQLVFGHDLNTIEKGDEDIIQRHLELMFPAFNRRLNAIVPYWRWFRLPQDRRLDRSIAAIHTWIGELVSAARERLDADPARAAAPANFLEAMIVARDADGRPFSDDVIFGNALTMLLAGEDTTAYTLAWAVHHLCEAPRAAAAIAAEMTEVLGGRPLPRDIDEAGKLSYATAVSNESMRLRPVAPMFFHEPVRDVVIGDLAVPKGTMTILLSRPPVLDEKRFRDPHAFAPERWIAGWEGAHDPSVNVPFGSGPRICPGRALAILEMRVVLAALYGTFEVERVGKAEEVKELMAFTMMPVGLRVRLRRRRRL